MGSSAPIKAQSKDKLNLQKGLEETVLNASTIRLECSRMLLNPESLVGLCFCCEKQITQVEQFCSPMIMSKSKTQMNQLFQKEFVPKQSSSVFMGTKTTPRQHLSISEENRT